MTLDGTVDYFVDTVFNYPTLAECYKVAAFNGLGRLIATRPDSSNGPHWQNSHSSKGSGSSSTHQPNQINKTLATDVCFIELRLRESGIPGSEAPSPMPLWRVTMTTAIGVVMTEHIVAGRLQDQRLAGKLLRFPKDEDELDTPSSRSAESVWSRILCGAGVPRRNDAIVHPFPLTPRGYDAGPPQIGEMPRNLGLALLKNLHEIANANLSAVHQVQ